MRANSGCRTKMSAALENSATAKIGAAARRAMACMQFPLGFGASATRRDSWEWTFSSARGYAADLMFPETLLVAAREIITETSVRKLKLATAESCTAGLISACLCQVPGSSAVVERGFVTYSNEAKVEMLTKK